MKAIKISIKIKIEYFQQYLNFKKPLIKCSEMNLKYKKMKNLIAIICIVSMALSANAQLSVDNATGNTFIEKTLRITTNTLTTNDYGFSMGGNAIFAIDAPSITGGRMTVLENGLIGFGTASPLVKMHVEGETYSSGARYMFTSGTTNADKMIISHSPAYPTWGLRYDDDFDQFAFQDGYNNTALFIDLSNYVTGSVGIGTETLTHTLTIAGDIGMTGTVYGISDRRVKKDFLPIDNALDQIEKLNPVSYHFKTDENPTMKLSDKRQMGLIAQEVLEIFPELVSVPESPDEMLSLNYTELIPVLVKSVQELNEQLEEKDEEIKARDIQIENILKRLEALEK